MTPPQNVNKELTDYRVMFQYIGVDGPQFEFTTVLADSVADATTQLLSARARDKKIKVVQVEASNGRRTGFSAKDVAEAIAEIEAERAALAAQEDAP